MWTVFAAIWSAFNRWKNSYPLFKKITARPYRAIKKGSVKRQEKDRKYVDDLFAADENARPNAVTGESVMADELSTYERRATDILKLEINRLEQEARRELLPINLRVKRLPSPPSIDSTSVIAGVDGKQESVLRAWQPRLRALKCAVLRTVRGLQAFRHENPSVLFRPARYYSPMFTYPGILAVCAIEMLLNYYVLLGSGGHTPTEIVMIVVIASLFNLMFGLLAGFIGARNLSYAPSVQTPRAKNRARRRKIAGFVSLVVGALLIVGLAFVMAHYRNAIDSALDDPRAATDAALRLERMALAKAAIGQTMRNDPFVFLGHLHAVLIFLLGLVFGFIAAVEGYYLIDDPYPGYGAADRICRQAIAAYEADVKRFEKEFAAITIEAAAALDEVLRRAIDRLNAIKSCFDGAAETIQEYEKAAASVQHAFHRSIMRYRETYLRVRGTSGPAHWEEIPHLDHEPSFDAGNFDEIEERTVADLGALEDQIVQLKSFLGTNQANAVARLKTYLETVDQDAAAEEELALSELFPQRAPAELSGDPFGQKDQQPKNEPPGDKAA
jgi:hypothetical protein